MNLLTPFIATMHKNICICLYRFLFYFPSLLHIFRLQRGGTAHEIWREKIIKLHRKWHALNCFCYFSFVRTLLNLQTESIKFGTLKILRVLYMLSNSELVFYLAFLKCEINQCSLADNESSTVLFACRLLRTEANCKYKWKGLLCVRFIDFL